MKAMINRQMQEFLTPKVNEEAVDMPLYHIQTYGTAGALTFTFFNTSRSAATNGLGDTNMDASSVLSAGKRFAVFGISVALFPGTAPVVFDNTSTLTSSLNDLQGVLEGIGHMEFNVLDKNYLYESPLCRLPAGCGAFSHGGGIEKSQASAADGHSLINHASNGMPMLTVTRKLRVPIPIPQQVRFEARAIFPALITVATNSRFGVWLDGVLIRARQ